MITKVDLDALLAEYGVTSESYRDRLHALNRGARQRGWWDRYRNDALPGYLTYVGFEAGAAIIKQFHLGVVPGLLQTAEYSEAVTIGGRVDLYKVKSIVGLRMQRQVELAQRSVPPRQYFVLDEAAIRRHVGIEKNPAIMANQLRHVADRAERDNLVTVRVIAFEAGAHPGLVESFNLLEFDGGLPDILFLDADRGEPTMVTGDDPKNALAVALAKEDFETLAEAALSAEDSIKLMRSVAAEMSTG